MAPTKKDAKDGEKEAKLTPEQSAKLVLEYLRKQNRPYSAIDISTNLRNRVTKAAAAKLLKDLHERKEIEGRAAGKQVVYHAIQDEADEAGLGQLQQMDAEAARLRDATTTLKAEEKELRGTLRGGAAQVPLPELRTAVATLEQTKAEMAGRLEKLTSGNVKPVSLKESEEINLEHRKWQKIAGARSTIRAELWKVIEGLIEKDKVAETKESLGLDF
ncbi:hypothetical protein BAUCODRAFT_358224 [Baudoinia panamericana UAMH 10762]|uniref:Homologous-pairing protein 2 winged helix domain-containing protein n=1 Tax=Baudoinia panamericana (strain UAMH 10762) TaxID=717646 RepID=M2N7B7_BAUPA|nr:uncharacterized protein BAUCODRAFT_358224 [Baudoinia panamericana UAMH 10762]EMC99983.1 hypothetical protein BAUCODRAFT_358224 [Baudoinia panamericana UAMH 10762]